MVRAACEACSSKWNLGTSSEFALGRRKTTENLNGFGQSQDLPNANSLLASSPVLSTRALTLVPICATALQVVFYKYFCVHMFWTYHHSIPI
jgi:hypothetical protein